MLVKDYPVKINVDIKKPLDIDELLRNEEKKLRKKYNLKNNILIPTDIEILFIDTTKLIAELTINFYCLVEENSDNDAWWGL